MGVRCCRHAIPSIMLHRSPRHISHPQSRELALEMRADILGDSVVRVRRSLRPEYRFQRDTNCPRKLKQVMTPRPDFNPVSSTAGVDIL